MKLIVTAGGTSEKIDNVRRITNTATGRLGRLIACELYAQGGDKIERIYYVGEESAAAPELPCLERIVTSGVADLCGKLRLLLSTEKVDAVVHSMAVSDYTVRSVTTAGALAGDLSAPGAETSGPSELRRRLTEALRKKNPIADSGKIPSDVDDLVLSLGRTPKVIPLFREMQPDAVLVGFKLLSGAAERDLLEAGFGVMRRNGCDLVFANDAASFTGGGQSGFLLHPDGRSEPLDGKPAIARRIAQAVFERLESRERK